MSQPLFSLNCHVASNWKIIHNLVLKYMNLCMSPLILNLALQHCNTVHSIRSEMEMAISLQHEAFLVDFHSYLAFQYTGYISCKILCMFNQHYQLKVIKAVLSRTFERVFDYTEFNARKQWECN